MDGAAATALAAPAGLDAEFGSPTSAPTALRGRSFDRVWGDDPDEWGSYAESEATFVHNDTVEWNHGIGAIVTNAPRCSCGAGRSRSSTATRTGATHPELPQIPLSFSLIASKPASP